MKLGIISLGCAKNRIDTELFLGVANKYQITITPNINEADILVVNTCGFIESAKIESIDTILEMADYKAQGKILIAMGCLVERYLDELKTSLPEVDYFVPIRSYDQIDQLFSEITKQSNHYQMDYTNRVITTPPHSAYLRIAEGCNNKCSYCAIPLIRGRYLSRPYNSLIAEATILAQKGVKEITVIAQDTTRYGTDLTDQTERLPALLNGLSSIDGLEIIRVLYLYPDEITDELIETIKNNKKIAKYFDIPIQHASDSLLKAMNRRGNQAFLTSLFEKIRLQIKDAIIRTTLIVGFPTETALDHQELLSFVKKIEFDRLGVFTYSDEEETVGFELLPKVPENIMKERLDDVMKLQQTINQAKMENCIGRTYTCIIDRYDSYTKKYVGRSYAFAPDDVDGNIYISGNQNIIIGNIYDVEITDYHTYDLFGIIKK